MCNIFIYILMWRRQREIFSWSHISTDLGGSSK